MSLGATLSPQERAVLEMDLAWVRWRGELREKLVRSGTLQRAWRSVFEADMILSIIGARWISGQTTTLKDLMPYLAAFVNESTLSRYVADLEASGLVSRMADENDRRRIVLVPSEKLLAVGQEFLRARIRIMKANGFAWRGGDVPSGER